MLVSLLTTLVLATPAFSNDEVLGSEVVSRVAKELSTRRFSPPGSDVRSVRDVFRNAAPAVPLIISREGVGSSVLIKRDGLSGLVVTNYHVVNPAFRNADGTAFVLAIFYEPRLARDVLDESRVIGCLTSRDTTPWCELLRKVTRLAVVVASDPDRDLALLTISKVPDGVTPIPPGALGDISPGDDVAVIGHPLGLLWSLTTGIVSGVRSNYPVSASAAAPRATVIQTQTPVNPGNSGGPLLTADGRLIGVIFASSLVRANTEAGTEIKVAASGLNLAIAINEVRKFEALYLPVKR